MPTTTPPSTAESIYRRMYNAVREEKPFSNVEIRPATIEVRLWTTIAASHTDEDGVERVDEDKIGQRQWDVSIPVRSEDEAKVLVAALGGTVGRLASARHPDCQWVVSVRREYDAA